MRLIAPPTPALLKRSAGVLMFVYWRGRWHVRAWPRKRGKATDAYQKNAQDEFKLAAKLTKQSVPDEWAAAQTAVTGTMYVPRDLLTRAIFGKLSTIIEPDGTEVYGVRMNVPEANLTLDQITVTPYALLVRTDQQFGWRGLVPGSVGQVLGIKPDGTPDYIDPAGSVESVFGRTGEVVALAGDYTALDVTYDPSLSGFSATDVQGALDELYQDLVASISDFPAYLQDALEILSASPGAILYRGASGWEALAPGTAGNLLSAQSGTPKLAWTAPPSGGAGVWYNPPASTSFPTLRNTPVLTDVPAIGLQFTGAAGSTTIRAAYQALGGDKVYTARVWFTGMANNVSAGLAMRDSAGGRCITFGLDFEGSQQKLQCTQWTSDTSATSNAWGAPVIASPYAFLRVTWHSVTKTFDLDVSYDGVNFLRMQTANAWVTNPNQIGFYVWSTTTGDFGAGIARGLCDYFTAV